MSDSAPRIRQNRYTLSFQPELERAFRERFVEDHRAGLRLAMIIAGAFYASYGFVDYILFPEQATLLHTIRYGAFLPVLLAALGLSFTKRYADLHQALGAALVFIAGASITIMILVTPPPNNYSYYPGLVVVFLYGYTFSRLRFTTASAAGWLIILFFDVAALIATDISPVVFVSNNVIFITANLSGMFACYSIETAARKDFAANRALERRVADRTEELETESRERQAAQERLRYRATHDELTGLLNRRSFLHQLSKSIASARVRGERVAVLFVDLDGFKNVNDSIGHPVGDELLVAVAARIRATLPSDASLARLGGDEFVVALADGATARQVIASVLSAFTTPFHVGTYELRITASIGASVFPLDGESVDVLLRSADAAMYDAKRGGRNGFSFFTPELGRRIARRSALDRALRRAVADEQLHLVYQPKVSLDTGSVTGFEVLLRWTEPELGPISPGEFIPVAEETGQMGEIGAWVIDQTCREVAPVLDAHPDWRVNVNISARQFAEDGLYEQIDGALSRYGIAAERLTLEITESVLMEHVDIADQQMQRLHERGVHFSVDDFGTGYSSLAYLSRFHISELKIDRSFVKDIVTGSADSGDQMIVRSVIALGHNLGLSVVSEGVENSAQARMLTQFCCDEAQGYYFARPLPVAEAVRAAVSQTASTATS